MRPEPLAPDDPHEWLNRARSNLVRAQTRIPDVYLDDFCFDAQQAAEKAIKAVLLKLGVDFPYVHDLVHLLHLAETRSAAIPSNVREAGRLTIYAFHGRYPGGLEPVTEEDYLEAVKMAAEVVEWAESLIG